MDIWRFKDNPFYEIAFIMRDFFLEIYLILRTGRKHSCACRNQRHNMDRDFL